MLKDRQTEHKSKDENANHTFSPFGFALHENQTFAKPKELNLSNAPNIQV